MTMLSMALAALVFSAIPLFALCLGDPKRLRTIGNKGSGMTSSQRRLLAAAAGAPGLICAILGNAAAFLMWLGGCALTGWTIAAFSAKMQSLGATQNQREDRFAGDDPQGFDQRPEMRSQAASCRLDPPTKLTCAAPSGRPESRR